MIGMKFVKIILVSVVLLITVNFVSAQEPQARGGEMPEGQRPEARQPQDIRIKMLRQLGLSREQIGQIRKLNQERMPLMQQAQKRFHDANQALDAAIYADQADDAAIDARLKEVNLAQAEITRIRIMNELGVRRILTPEQLARFRELRQRFEQARRNFENRAWRDGSQRNPSGMKGERNIDRGGQKPASPVGPPPDQDPDQ